jgi:hypothetical protein
MGDTETVPHAFPVLVVGVFGPSKIAQASDENPIEHPHWHIGHDVQEVVACRQTLDSVLYFILEELHCRRDLGRLQDFQENWG